MADGLFENRSVEGRQAPSCEGGPPGGGRAGGLLGMEQRLSARKVGAVGCRSDTSAATPRTAPCRDLNWGAAARPGNWRGIKPAAGVNQRHRIASWLAIQRGNTLLRRPVSVLVSGQRSSATPQLTEARWQDLRLRALRSRARREGHAARGADDACCSHSRSGSCCGSTALAWYCQGRVAGFRNTAALQVVPCRCDAARRGPGPLGLARSVGSVPPTWGLECTSQGL